MYDRINDQTKAKVLKASDTRQTLLKMEQGYATPWFPAPYADFSEKGLRRSLPMRIMLFFQKPNETIMGKWFSVLIMFLIFLSVAVMMGESHPDMNPRPANCKVCSPLRFDDQYNDTKVGLRAQAANYCSMNCETAPMPFLRYLEIFCVAVFTLEYMTRLVVCPFVPLKTKLGRSSHYNTLVTSRTVTLRGGLGRLYRFVTRYGQIETYYY